MALQKRKVQSLLAVNTAPPPNLLPAGIGCPVPRIPAEATPLADHVSATRILCGALVFPTIATIVGKLMFSSVNSNLQRTILVSPPPPLRHRAPAQNPSMVLSRWNLGTMLKWLR